MATSAISKTRFEHERRLGWTIRQNWPPFLAGTAKIRGSGVYLGRRRDIRILLHQRHASRAPDETLHADQPRRLELRQSSTLDVLADSESLEISGRKRDHLLAPKITPVSDRQIDVEGPTREPRCALQRI